MDFLPGFVWPVPRAFTSAVSAGRFEQGDVFYDAPAAYSAWKASKAKSDLPFRLRVQVQDPPRSARAAPADAEGNRFAGNWSSPVTVELSDYQRAQREEVTSTQGRLFTCLWRGDPGVLREAKAGDADPPLPVGARELQKHLDACVPALRRKAGKRASPGSAFVSVVDASSEASLSKARGILAALAADHVVHLTELSPEAAGVPEGDTYHPALVVRALWIEAPDLEPLREILKGALYGPTAKGGAAGEAPDRFKLERHGLLVSS